MTGGTSGLVVAFGVAFTLVEGLEPGVIEEIDVLPGVLVGDVAKDEGLAHEISKNEQNSRTIEMLFIRLTSIKCPSQ